MVQSFTAHMPLLTATSAFGLRRICWSSPQQCYLHLLTQNTDSVASRVVSMSDCSVRGPRFESHHGRLCLSRQLLWYTALGTGCTPLLQYLGRLSLPPSVGWVIITMAMTDVDDSCQFPADSQPKSIGLSGGWRPPDAQSAFIKWTGWTLAMTLVMMTAP